MATNEEKTEFAVDQGIPSFFKDANVFITGGTGFVGQVLISKLLRSCPSIGRIYIHMRRKKGEETEQRFEEFFDQPVFEKMKKFMPNYLSKVTPVDGDCSEPNLGMSQADIDLILENVNIVFHLAATVNFDAKLRDAVNTNVRATSDLLDIAKNMKHLKVFVHVSTTYSFCGSQKILEEKIYEPPMNPDTALSLVNNLDDAMLEKLTPSLLGSYQNTYIFTKTIAEWLCVKKDPGLPIIVFRPAIVTSTAEDPIPGWINNVYGPTAVFAAASVGLLRTMNLNEDIRSNIVPCDYVVNAMIASAWYTAETWRKFKKNTKETPQVPVFNYSSTEMENPMTWKVVADTYKSMESEIPSSKCIGVYYLRMNKHKLLHKAFAILFHILPAIIIDIASTICGKPTRMMHSYAKIHKFLKAISYFCMRDWSAPNANVTEMWSRLSECDKQTFKFNIDDLDWKTYFRNYARGIRLYVIKDKEETIPYGLKRRRMFTFAFWSVIGVFVILFLYACFSVCRSILHDVELISCFT